MALHLKSTGIDFTDFSGPTAGSSVDELLDDYEEGTWTPNLHTGWEGAGSGNAIYYSKYTKTGRLVFVAFGADWGMTGSTVRITGGPFAIISGFLAPAQVAMQNNFTAGGFARYGSSQFDWIYSSSSVSPYFHGVSATFPIS